MSEKIHLTVATVVQRNGKFLIVEEKDQFSGALVYNQPAGHVDPGETILQAAIRETYEETGWQVTLTGFLGTFSHLAPDNAMYHRMAFVAKPEYFDEKATIDPDIVNTHWVDSIFLRNYPEKMRSPLVLKAIDSYEKGTIYPLHLFQ